MFDGWQLGERQFRLEWKEKEEINKKIRNKQTLSSVISIVNY